MQIDNKVKWGIGIFAVVAVLAVLIPNLIFRRPNNHDEARYGVVHIHMADGPEGWSQHHVAAARAALPELNRLGPTFVLGGEGRSIRVVNVNLTVNGRCTGAAAQYVVRNGTDSHIEIDPTCTQGDDAFRTALMHEVGHFLGMQHICRTNDNQTPSCSVVGRGPAVMNPSLTVDSEDVWSTGPSGETHVPNFPVPMFEVQALDVREFCRVVQGGCTRRF